MNPQYERWRASIPFSNAQIVAALREDAAGAYHEFGRLKMTRAADHLERTGRLSSWMFRQALPRLIKRCAICGKVALYRYGLSGRCRTHRLIPTIAFTRKIARLELKSSALASDKKAADYLALDAKSQIGRAIKHRQHK